MDKAKKKQLKKITTWVLLAALVVLLTAMPLLAKAEAEADGPVASVYSGTVAAGSVSTTLRGGGTLKTEDVEDVILPTGVKITEFLVKNGDHVTAGTPLACVDKVSVMTAITSVRETMDYLQEEIRGAKDEKIGSTVAATAGGYVKKVYAETGDSVQDVMLEHGALALLSLDGLMAVELEKKMELLTGDTVKVFLADGTEVTGRVASNLDGVIVITLEDDHYSIGEAVTVTTRGGETVGEGELYVHNAWAATAFGGTIQTVNAKEENKVSSGTTLFTLTDTDFQGTLEYMSSLHREYEDLMQDLFKMYNSGTIDAPCDGMISGIDKDSAHLLAGEEDNWQITLLNHRPAQSFVAFAAKVTGKTADSLQLAVDPRLISLESLHNLCEVETDAAAMTRNRSYPADTAICVQNASGALVPNSTGEIGDILLFIGDENGVLWVVAPEKSEPTTAYGVSLMSEVQPSPEQETGCSEDLDHCTGTNHDRCILACTRAVSESGCRAERHYADCIHSCLSKSTVGTCPAQEGHHKRECIESCTEAGLLCKEGGYHKLGCIKSCKHANVAGGCKDTKYPHYPDCIDGCISSDGTRDCPATKHLGSCIETCDHADTAGICDSTLHHYPDCIMLCISSNSGSKTCPASKHYDDCFFCEMQYRAKVALVTQVSTHDQELLVKWDSSNMEYEVEKVGAGWRFASDQGFNMDLLVKSGKLPVSNPSAYKPGDVVFVVTGYKNEVPVWSGIPVFMNISGGINPDLNLDINLDLNGLLGGLTGMMMPDLSALLKGFGSFGFYAPSPVEEEKLFDLEGSTLMTVSPEETVSVVITLDEQDIACVCVGQDALVKVEALGEQTFTAQVTEVAARGINSGGSSKFAVKLEMEKAKNMIDGMSATASVPMLTRENVPTIPVMALAEQGAHTVVYTALDEKTGELIHPVPVSVGLSDGSTAEILSGLEIGDTYYYSYYDVVEENTGVEDRFTLR